MRRAFCPLGVIEWIFFSSNDRFSYGTLQYVKWQSVCMCVCVLPDSKHSVHKWTYPWWLTFIENWNCTADTMQSWIVKTQFFTKIVGKLQTEVKMLKSICRQLPQVTYRWIPFSLFTIRQQIRKVTRFPFSDLAIDSHHRPSHPAGDILPRNPKKRRRLNPKWMDE